MEPPLDPYLVFSGYAYDDEIVRVYRDRHDDAVHCCPVNAPMLRNGTASHPDPTVRPAQLRPLPDATKIYPSVDLLIERSSINILSMGYRALCLAPFHLLGLPTHSGD